jgi:succinylglutamate desuccinylase
VDDFLALTLAGRLPHHFHGQTAHFRWHWIDCGILQLIPHEPCDRSLVLSSGLHGNETAPVEITDLLLRQLFRGEIPLRWRLLAIFGNPPALRANKRYMHSDINRMFGERWRALAPAMKPFAPGSWSMRWRDFMPGRPASAGTWIYIPPYAVRCIPALVSCRRGIRRGMKRFCAG